MKSIVELDNKEIIFVAGGGLFSDVGSYLGLIGGIVIGTFATNYCARTTSGILSKIFIMLAFAVGGVLVGKVTQKSIQF